MIDCLQDAANPDGDYLEPIEYGRHAADVDNGWHGNDDAIQPQYAEVVSTRRRDGPVSRRPYADVAEYAAIDHSASGHTYLLVVNDP